MLQIKDIIKGHVYKLLNVNSSLSEARKEQCLNCPLLNGNSCNKALAIRTELNEFKENKVVYTSNLNNPLNLPNNSTQGFIGTEEYTSGCGCNLEAKRTLMNHTCPINLWKDIDNEFLSCKIEASEINEYNKLGVVRFANKHKRDIIWRK
jgi:hypothetical protein